MEHYFKIVFSISKYAHDVKINDIRKSSFQHELSMADLQTSCIIGLDMVFVDIISSPIIQEVSRSAIDSSC